MILAYTVLQWLQFPEDLKLEALCMHNGSSQEGLPVNIRQPASEVSCIQPYGRPLGRLLPLVLFVQCWHEPTHLALVAGHADGRSNFGAGSRMSTRSTRTWKRSTRLACIPATLKDGNAP